MNHERLDSYRRLREVASVISRELVKWPKGYGELTDQLKRALISSILNLAEGNTRRGKERQRFFEISRGSLSEVAACLDLSHIFHLVKPAKIESLKKELRICYAMIRKLP